MRSHTLRTALHAGAAALLVLAIPAGAQENMEAPPPTGWSLMTMGQLFPVVTVGAPGEEETPFRDTEWYLTQPAVMANLESPGRRWVLRTTLNFEPLTLEDGELTFGGWGEGFIDKRHPHTLLHELMLSLNFWEAAGGALSLSGGRGFAPYGTSDPMARPGLKYPTNHHLSQVLERWTLNGAFLRDGWSVELGVFGGTEPEGAYDFDNVGGFGRSASARLARRWGAGAGPAAEWEASASFASVEEEHDGESERTTLLNAALRHARPLPGGSVYSLLEASRSDPPHGEGFLSVLGEARLERGPHQPYARVEWATRPEYDRLGLGDTGGFFRYDHDGEPVGATRWVIATAGYGYRLTTAPLSLRPFVEVQYHDLANQRGEVVPSTAFGTDAFWSLSLGARIFFGGGPMRMGTYGVLDPMTHMARIMGAGGGHEMDAGHETAGAHGGGPAGHGPGTTTTRRGPGAASPDGERIGSGGAGWSPRRR